MHVLAVLAVPAWSPPSGGLRAHTPLARTACIRCDEDRCYYGQLDADGKVIAGPRVKVERGTPLKPSPSLTPEQVIDAQFKGFSMDERIGIEDAFAFVAPSIIRMHDMTVDKYEQILRGNMFDGILGCAEWKVLRTRSVVDGKMVLTVRILPKPIPGCVKTSGLASQDGITWPTYYAWHLAKQNEEPYKGCWMLEQMAMEQVPIDVDAEAEALNLPAA